MKELHYLNKYFFKYKYSFLLGIIITIIAQIFSLFTPKLIGSSINAIEEHLKLNVSNPIIIREILLKNILLILGTTLLAAILTFFMRQMLIVMSRHIEFDLKNEIFKQYEHLTQNF